MAKLQDSGSRWDDVRIFLEAYREKSLGAAARRLALDTSTMSRRLAALEESLGVKLFERTRQGLLATHAAEQLLPAAEAMAAAHARLARDASHTESRVEGVVRLSVGPGFADAFVAPLLPKLHKRHPGVVLELDASVGARDLTRREADLALRTLRPEGSELVVTKLWAGPWLAVGAPALVRKLGRLDAWGDAPWISWDHNLSSSPAARWVTANVPRERVLLFTSHMASQMAAAEAGLGLMLVPEPFLRVRKLEPAALSPKLAASARSWPSDSLWLVGHRALSDVPRVAAVWEFLKDELRAQRR